MLKKQGAENPVPPPPRGVGVSFEGGKKFDLARSWGALGLFFASLFVLFASSACRLPRQDAAGC